MAQPAATPTSVLEHVNTSGPDLSTEQAPPYVLAPEQVPDAMVVGMKAEVERQAKLADAAEARSKAAKAQEDTGEALPADPAPPVEHVSLEERLAAELLLSLKREATDWVPRTVTVGAAGVPQQIAGRRAFRQTLVISAASADVTIARTQAALLADNPTDVVTLTSTDSPLSLSTEGPAFVTAAAGTTLQVIETYYDLGALVEAAKRLAHAITSGQVQEVIG